MEMSMAREKTVWLLLAAAWLLGGAAPSPAAAAKPVAVQRTIGSAGIPIPRSFAGLSIEYPSTEDYFGAPGKPDRKSTRLNSSHQPQSRMPSSA